MVNATYTVADSRVILQVNVILEGGQLKLPAAIAANDEESFKYAPLRSCDVHVHVERSFSSYKNILTDKRQNFLFEHL